MTVAELRMALLQFAPGATVRMMGFDLMAYDIDRFISDGVVVSMQAQIDIHREVLDFSVHDERDTNP